MASHVRLPLCQSDSMGEAVELTCRFVDKHLADYLNGSLDSETSQEFRWHLARCPKCRNIGSDALRIVRSFLATRVDDTANLYTAT